MSKSARKLPSSSPTQSQEINSSSGTANVPFSEYSYYKQKRDLFKMKRKLEERGYGDFKRLKNPVDENTGTEENERLQQLLQQPQNAEVDPNASGKKKDKKKKAKKADKGEKGEKKRGSKKAKKATKTRKHEHKVKKIATLKKAKK